MPRTSRGKRSTKILGNQHLAVLADGDADSLPLEVTGQDIPPVAGTRHPLPDHGGGKLLLGVPGSRGPATPLRAWAVDGVVGNVFAPQAEGVSAYSGGAIESGPPVTVGEVAAFRIGVGEKAPPRHIPAVIAGDLVQGAIPCQLRQPGPSPFQVDELVDSIFQPGDIDAGLLLRGQRAGAGHAGKWFAGGRCDAGRCARGDGFGQPAAAEQHKKHGKEDCLFSHGGQEEVVF